MAIHKEQDQHASRQQVALQVENAELTNATSRIKKYGMSRSCGILEGFLCAASPPIDVGSAFFNMFKYVVEVSQI